MKSDLPKPSIWQRGEVSLPLFVGLAIWSFLAIGLIVQTLNIPYLGIRFVDKIQDGFIVVESIAPGSPASKSGVKVGEKLVAVGNPQTKEWQAFSGYEALKGRTKLHNYEMANKFFEAKNRGWWFLEHDQVAFENQEGQQFIIEPVENKLAHMFSWRRNLSLGLSVVVIFIALGIWSFAPKAAAVRLLALSGFCLSIVMLTGGISHSVEFVAPPEFFKLKYTLNTLAGLLFLYGLMGFLWHFPKRINNFPFATLALGFGVFAFLVQYYQWFEFPVHPFQMPNLITFPSAIIISAIQWRRTRNNPIDRASMMWVMMTIFGFTTIVVLLYSIPILLKFTPIITPQFATVSLTLIYIGIALGTLRYRLFDIHRIWWKAVTWLAGGFLVLLTDVVLISFLDLEQKAALPLALLLAGWVYFPIRQAVLRLFVDDREVRVADNIPSLIETFSQLENTEQYDGRFAAYLRNVFKADEIGELGREPLESSVLEQNGLALRIPNISQTGSILLIGKSHGRRIFSPRDVQAAESFVSLSRNMNDARQRTLAIKRQDRERIVRDLHDDVGGRLLNLIYQSKDKKIAMLARETLGALKESLIVVEDVETIEFSLAWQQMRKEFEARFNSANKKITVEEKIVTERILSAREFVNIKRIIQELVSNAIKYSDKKGVLIQLDVDAEATISLSTRNECRGEHVQEILDGRGLSNIRNRLEEIGGGLKISRSKKSKLVNIFRARFVLPISH